MLIKIRLLQSLQNLRNALFVYERLPNEIVDKIRKMLTSSTVRNNKRIMSFERKELEDLIKTLESQLKQLHAAVKSANKYFWPGISAPETYLGAEVFRDKLYIDRTYPDREERAKLAVKMFHDCFVETPGAIQKIKELEEAEKDFIELETVQETEQ